MSLAIYSRQNHRIIRLSSPQLLTDIDLSWGAQIAAIVDRASGINILYENPCGLDGDIGGWYELFPNAGGASTEPAVPMHGDVRSTTWHLTKSRATPHGGRVSMEVVSNALPFRLRRTVRLEGTLIRVDESIENLSRIEQAYLWGHHITFGIGMLGDGVEIAVSATGVFATADYDSRVATVKPSQPTALSALPGKAGRTIDLSRFPNEPASEMLFASEVGQSAWARIASSTLSATVRWDRHAFPALWLWYENGGSPTATGGDKIAAFAIEPQSSSIPNLRDAIAAGAAPVLPGGQLRRAWVELSLESV